MKMIARVVILVLLSAGAPAALAADGAKSGAQTKRDKIDANAQRALDELFELSPKAKDLSEKAYGWAVFTNVKVTFVVTGGGGSGVAVNKGSGERIYMKMGTGGLSLGIGGQKLQVIFFFEDERTFDGFVNKGWQADAQANAAAGTAGANVQSTFKNGLAVYQLTRAGLMASADISGTKYWQSKKLND